MAQRMARETLSLHEATGSEGKEENQDRIHKNSKKTISLFGAIGG